MPSLDVDSCGVCPFVWHYQEDGLYRCSREDTFIIPNYPEIPVALCPLNK